MTDSLPSNDSNLESALNCVEKTDASLEIRVEEEKRRAEEKERKEEKERTETRRRESMMATYGERESSLTSRRMNVSYGNLGV